MTIRRRHTDANVAPAVAKLKAQVLDEYPKSGPHGIWPSRAHTRANPRSLHEAGNAIDIMERGIGRAGLGRIFAAIVRSGDERVDHIIHAGRIWSPERGLRPYTGSNSHSGHIHVGVKESRREDARAWTIEAPKPKPRPEVEGDKPKHRRKVEVTSRGLNVRSGPGTSFKVLRTLTRGAKVEVVGDRGEWLALAAGGWVHGDYTKPVKG